MTEILRLTLLGSPRILFNTQPLTSFATHKAEALLFYLAVTGQPHSRDGLANLLWDGMTDTQAKKNLRTILPDLRRHLGDYLQLDRQTIAFQSTKSYWLDVAVLRQNLMARQAPLDTAARQAALALYQGEFLSGFYVHNAPAFEAWVLEQREQLHTLVVTEFSALVHERIQRADYTAALAANRHLLGLEPWSEPVHRQQMLLLAKLGERAAALAQYETCQRMLAAEFDVAPLPETTTLYHQIRAGEIAKQLDQDQAAMVVSAQSQPPHQPVAATDERKQTDLASNDGEQNKQESELPSLQPSLQVDGHNLPRQGKLYGRQAELLHLQQWIIEEGCRLVGIFGIGGQGKTALAATFVRALVEPHRAFATKQPEPLQPTQTSEGSQQVPATRFRRVIWQSLLNAPPFAEAVQEWLYILSDQTVTRLPASLEQQFSQLLDYFRQQPCLLILDNVESILQEGERGGYYRPGYEAYGQLFHRMVENDHHSCLLLTSREWPHDIAHLEEDTVLARCLSLAGLSAAVGRQMLQVRGVVGDSAHLAALVHHYSGNPLALKLVAETVHSLFDSDITTFLQTEALVFDDIRDILDQQFARLTPLERELLIWLAIVREPVSYTVLRDLLAQPPAPHLILEAVRSLQRRSLLEKYEDGFGLQNVVLEYTTALLIENMGRELEYTPDKLATPKDTDKARDSQHAGAVKAQQTQVAVVHDLAGSQPSSDPDPAYLNRYALILAQTKEYVRASQTRLILQPVAEQLLAQLGRKGTEQQLQRLLARLRTVRAVPGYAAANLLHLLLQLGVDLTGYNFSHLYLRQAYLRGVSLPQTNFAQSDLSESVFTEPFGLVYTAIFSPDGQYVAAGTGEGAIYIWRTADQQLAQVIQAHNQAIKQLAFAQRTTATGTVQLALVSAGDDNSVGFWLLNEHNQVRWHMQLSHPKQKSAIALRLGPDGQRVTCIDNEGQLFMWDVIKQLDAPLIQHFSTIPTRLQLIAFSKDGQTVAVGERAGTVQLWQIATGEAGLKLVVPTGAIVAITLSDDGQFLVTGGKEGHICLWALPTGDLLQVIETNTGVIDALDFSPNGKILASTHWDRAIRLWAVDAQGHAQLRHTLSGHTHVIWSVVFGPPPTPGAKRNRSGSRPITRQLLVSGSSDQTVRVWDAETGQSLYTLRGQPRALASLALGILPQTPPSTDTDIDIDADIGTKADTSEYPITQQRVEKAEWLLAAVSYDQLVYLWQGRGNKIDTRHRTLRGTHSLPYTIAISPSGRIVASAGNDRIIYLWHIASGQLIQTLHGHTNSIHSLAFQPNGELLASCSTDGTIRLWAYQEVEDDLEHIVAEVLPGQPVAVLQANLYYVYDIAFSPDSAILASAGSNCSLRLWDMTQSHYPELFEIHQTLKEAGEQDVFSVAFSPDGTKLACGGNHFVHLCDFPSKGESPLILRQHTAWIFSVAFSPDGTILASGGADATICLWNVADGSLRAILRGHSESVYKAVFSLDGTAVVSCSFDGTVKFWDSQTGEYISTLVVDGPYAGMNIEGITGITEAQQTALKALGATGEN